MRMDNMDERVLLIEGDSAVTELIREALAQYEE